jgi:hypothetical protein
MQTAQPARVARPLQRYHQLLAHNKKWRVRVSTFGLRLPARPGGDAGSSARQGRLSAAALSPLPGTKQKMEDSSLNIWIFFIGCQLVQVGTQAAQPTRVACPLQRYQHFLTQNNKWRVRILIFGLRLPACLGGDAGSSAHQGFLSAAALSPATGTKQ